MNTNPDQLDLRLVASPGAWRLYSARQADVRFKKYEDKVFQRDRYTCRFCGFQAKTDQHIVNQDGNYNNNKLDNLVTSCCFCAQCFFVESVGVGGYGGGTLIYLPEMTQVALNALCHVLFCAMTNDTGYKNTSQSIYRSFKMRSQVVEDKFGEGTSDPAILGHLLIDSDYIAREQIDPLFHDIRLLPSRAKFRKQIERWAANALEELVSQ
jgi:intracellular multiplication protein IcmJ